MKILFAAAICAAAFVFATSYDVAVMAHPGGLHTWELYRAAHSEELPIVQRDHGARTLMSAVNDRKRERALDRLREDWKAFDARYWASLEPEISTQQSTAVENYTPVITGTSEWWPTIMCESGGDPWAYNPAGPYMGLLQFDQQTWEVFGGEGTPMGKGYAETVAVAERVTYDAWPNC